MAGMPPDFSQMFNTRLTPQEESAYQGWAKANNRQNDSFDYDMRGAWKANVSAGANEHYPDTYKKPNHPTFSNQSMYSGPHTGYAGGTWSNVGPTNAFTPSQHNLRMTPMPELKSYFNGPAEAGNNTVLMAPWPAGLK